MVPSSELPAAFDSGVRPEEVLVERPRLLETPWGAMALFRLGEEEIVCVQAFCPHLQGPLFQGSVARGRVTCPWHDWRFDLRTGERVDWKRPLGGEGCRPLLRCAVRVGPAGTLELTPLPR
jgi:nitrite reductase/ring-hydroxylating ferredoxin subunit